MSAASKYTHVGRLISGGAYTVVSIAFDNGKMAVSWH